MYIWILILAILAEGFLGHPSPWLRLRYGFARLLRRVRGAQMQRPARNEPLREALTFALPMAGAFALGAALGLPLPWLALPAYYLALDARTLTERAMSVKQALDHGRLIEARAHLTQLTAAAQGEDYDSIVRDATGGLMHALTRSVLGLLLVVLVLLPFGLGPAAAFAYVMLAQLAQNGNRVAGGLYRGLYRLLLPVTSLCVVLASALVRLRTGKAWAAFLRHRRQPGLVLLAALGVAPGESGRDVLVSGDITQGCVVAWIIVAMWVAAALLLYALLGLL